MIKKISSGPANGSKKNELIKLYQHAQASLAPLQWEEPFGLTYIEAQACGTPVIAFDRGSLKEIIEDGKTGFIVKNETEMEQAAAKISYLSRTACRQWIQNRFSIQTMVDNYENLFYDILKKSHISKAIKSRTCARIL